MEQGRWLFKSAWCHKGWAGTLRSHRGFLTPVDDHRGHGQGENPDGEKQFERGIDEAASEMGPLAINPAISVRRKGALGRLRERRSAKETAGLGAVLAGFNHDLERVRGRNGQRRLVPCPFPVFEPILTDDLGQNQGDPLPFFPTGPENRHGRSVRAPFQLKG